MLLHHLLRLAPHGLPLVPQRLHQLQQIQLQALLIQQSTPHAPARRPHVQLLHRERAHLRLRHVLRQQLQRVLQTQLRPLAQHRQRLLSLRRVGHVHRVQDLRQRVAPAVQHVATHHRTGARPPEVPEQVPVLGGQVFGQQRAVDQADQPRLLRVRRLVLRRVEPAARRALQLRLTTAHSPHLNHLLVHRVIAAHVRVEVRGREVVPQQPAAGARVLRLLRRVHNAGVDSNGEGGGGNEQGNGVLGVNLRVVLKVPERHVAVVRQTEDKL